MKLINLTFIIGLPCSGKTTFLKGIKESCLKIDDPIDFKTDVKDKIIKYISKSNLFSCKKDIYISDCNLCNDDILIKAITRIEDINMNFNFKYIYFENNVDKCLINLKKRKEKGDNREVENYIKQLSKIYTPVNYININC
jgi:uridine kinase